VRDPAGTCTYRALIYSGYTFWLNNSFLAYFFLVFLWGHTLIAFSFLISTFFSNPRTATVIGYSLILASGLLSQNLLRNYFDNSYTPNSTIFGVAVVPQFSLYRGLNALSDAVVFNGRGMKWSEIYLPEYRLDEVYIFLVIQWAICLVLAFYFESVLPVGPGLKKHPLFILPFLRCRGKKDEGKSGKNAREIEDVAAERVRVESPDCQDEILIRNLRKVFPGQNGSATHVAVSDLSLGIRRGECVGFLGPNGAGKSTTINMLSGYLRPSSGSVFMNGLDIKDHIDEIHMQMGVCPQDDVLWHDLTGPEHLRFYGRLKNLEGAELEGQVDFWLQQVNLAGKKTRVKLSSEYSGGMKRRLSVAIALIGDPSVVLLDEPTYALVYLLHNLSNTNSTAFSTGLDPASRRDLWKVIIAYRSKCAMLLTTHSMEEAEALCNRLGIFVASELKGLGGSAQLKERYGQYYKVIITTLPGQEQPPFQVLQRLAPNIRLMNALAGTASYEIPRSEVRLSDVFEAIESNKKNLGVMDWGISNATLEEVFLKIAESNAENEIEAMMKNIESKKGGCCGKRSSKSDSDIEDGTEMK
jgi:ABC-type multidrug transport system ATPase subunit